MSVVKFRLKENVEVFGHYLYLRSFDIYIHPVIRWEGYGQKSSGHYSRYSGQGECYSRTGHKGTFVIRFKTKLSFWKVFLRGGLGRTRTLNDDRYRSLDLDGHDWKTWGETVYSLYLQLHRGGVPMNITFAIRRRISRYTTVSILIQSVNRINHIINYLFVNTTHKFLQLVVINQNKSKQNSILH